MAHLLYFRGKGTGFMSGVNEYVVLVDEGDQPLADVVKEHTCPGFEAKSAYEVEVGDGDWPTDLPTDVALARRG